MTKLKYAIPLTATAPKHFSIFHTPITQKRPPMQFTTKLNQKALSFHQFEQRSKV